MLMASFKKNHKLSAKYESNININNNNVAFNWEKMQIDRFVLNVCVERW